MVFFYNYLKMFTRKYKLQCIFLLYCLFTNSATSNSVNNNNDLNTSLEEIIFTGLVAYETTGNTTTELEEAVKNLLDTSAEKSNLLDSAQNSIICITCSGVSRYIITRLRLGISYESLTTTLLYTCMLFKISTQRVCQGYIDLNTEVFAYIIKNNKKLNEYIACATILQNYECYKNYRSQWSVDIPNQDSSYIARTSKGESFRVLQITDLHLDPLYNSGGNADCGEPLCCQIDQGSAPSNSTPAGKWGDYRNCDMPYSSFANFLQQITQQISQSDYTIDYVYFTGDVISHRAWNTSKEFNNKLLTETYRALKESFQSIPVYSAVGNHEVHPLDVFSPPDITNNLSTRWVFDTLAECWSPWLPSDTNNTVRYGGFYSTIIKPGLRLITVNSNFCYIYNWWLLYDAVDPFSELKWLVKTLRQAEIDNEIVHILSHIPPGDDTCLQEWTRQFRRIVERFSHLIKGQFNGHTHFDELKVFYNKSNPMQVVNVAYNGGSFTTFTNLNPNYRYYTIDSDTFEVLDYEQWIYYLDAANSEPDATPVWFKQYSFKEAYGLTSMDNEAMGNLISRMARSISLQDKYYRFKIRASTPLILEGCSSACRKKNICEIVTTEVDDDKQCEALVQTCSHLFS